MKNIIWIIIVLIIIAGLLFIFLRDGEVEAPVEENDLIVDEINEEDIIEENGINEEEEGEEMSEVIEVLYSNEGFSPSTVEVELGQRVKFVNQSSRNMWVASDPHPTHTIYPEFDQRNAVSNGGTYEFTFNKEGSWDYHNHTHPNSVGTVIVK